MLQLKNISKLYQTGNLRQTALDDVSLNLRNNEFVAILGPSGSGKTTLLNMIGGLDRYDQGDLIINGISTKQYKDRDWDSYRNHTIGFVFQSYNLIPHQSILSNVELALTISGMSRSERRKKAKQALEEVGLGDQLHKRPNQMSGGQMQRVAIARALINDPDILLADEPTGALDSETSVQVMELLKKVAKDRLVVMVTHNPELAQEYANRIVKLRDGKIIDDSNPYELAAAELKEPEHKSMGKASMSFMTSLALSFNNLRTKKGRTLLTSFAGSIGIIGIALILSISNGVNTYIADLQKDTMTSYPITIEEQTIDLSSLMTTQRQNVETASEELDHDLNNVYANGRILEMAASMTTSITKNNLTEFKKYLDDPNSEIHQYVGENGITYSYNTKFSVFTHDTEDVIVNTDGSTLEESKLFGTGNSMMPMMGMSQGTSNNFGELMPGTNGALIGSAIVDSYDVLYGAWPAAYDEVVLVLDENNEIPQIKLYQLGILPSSEYNKIMKQMDTGKEVTFPTKSWGYKEICEQSFYLVPACDQFREKENGLYEHVGDSNYELESLMENAIKLKIVGVIRPKEDADHANFFEVVGYTSALTNHLIEYTNNSKIIKAQQNSPDRNILNGVEFSPADDAAKIEDTKTYMSNLSEAEKAKMCREVLQSVSSYSPESAEQMLTMTDAQLAMMLDEYMSNLDNTPDDNLLMLYNTYISTGSYDENMSEFGYVSLDHPSGINIYTDSFEDKESITDCIKDYNQGATEENQITYTDYVGLLMSSVTTIVNVISYVLIAFVGVSLIVSSIMIGIITYISVLERTKEIGILRALGASKHNISQVFNAETFIVGLCAGLIGVIVSALLLIPGNALIHALTDSTNVNASLPVGGAIILVILSMILTLIGGFIPAKKAARKDPVTALRTE